MTTYVLICIFAISASSAGTARVAPIPTELAQAIRADQAVSDSHQAAVSACRARFGAPAQLAWVETRTTAVAHE